MFAVELLKEGEIIVLESPLVSCQFSWNKAYGYLACEHCMFPLENAEANIRRLTFDPTIVLPYPEADSTESLLTNIVSCEECGAKFCSLSCHEEAGRKYHKMMCPHLKPNQALDSINEIWK
jgi:SET and MYND domain-containing protein 5